MICSKKIYPTKKIAKIYKRKMESIHGTKLKIYRCPHCNLLHLKTKKTADEEAYFRIWKAENNK